MKLGAKFLYNYSAKDAPHKYKDDTWHAMCFSTPTRMPFPWKGDERYPEYDEFIGKYFFDGSIKTEQMVPVKACDARWIRLYIPTLGSGSSVGHLAEIYVYGTDK